ncbi:MAG: hypothetical protein ABIO69_08870 [Sphingomicrobium sp.]
MRGIFGRKKPSVDQMKEMLAPAPDGDGVTRVFSKELWDNPEIGGFLREMGMNPDDPRNRVTTADEHIARFARAREALEVRAAAFNAERTREFGHCNARPMLIIGPDIWDGPHGAFLYGQLDLCGYDEWNVLMCAGDRETIDRCGLVGHPGSIPALTQKIMEKILSLKGRFQEAHDSLGRRILGEPGIDSTELNATVAELRRELVDYVAFCRGKVIETLSTPPA